MLHFHAKAFALLPSVPAVSAMHTDLLSAREAELGLRWPASIREWYSLEGAVELLRRHSNDDDPVPIERLGAPVAPWYGETCRDFLSKSLLLIMLENQGVCNWAVQLDGSPDPPVVVAVDTAPDELWLPATQSFSEFVYCQIWDHAHMSACCAAQEPALALDDLAYLRSRFQQGPTTYGWPGSANYRFTTPWGRILIWYADHHGADWYLSASSDHDLAQLLRAIWQCGTLAKSLYGCGCEGEECLAQARLA